MVKIYIGTYTTDKSKGIYQFDYDNGFFNNVSLLCEISNPKYLCQYKDYIVACCDCESGSGIALIDTDGHIIDKCIYEACTSCYVCSKDGYIYTANYHEGTFNILRIIDNHIELVKTIKIKDKAGCHQVIIHNDCFYIPCLFLDKILVYDKGYNLINEINFPVGSGPRHGVIYEDKMYLVSELTSHLFVIDLKSLKIINDIRLLDEDYNGSAAIRLSNDNKYILISIRNRNVIVSVDIKDLTVKCIRDCSGDHPRDFIIVDDYVLCANRLSNNVVSMKLNDGCVCGNVSNYDIPEGVCCMEYQN